MSFTADDFIDAHSHVWTPDVAAYPLAAGFEVADMSPASFTPDELLAECRPLGVRRVVLIQMSYYKFDNRYLLDAIATSPDVFSGVATIDPGQPDLRDAMRRLALAGVRGFRLYAQRNNVEAWRDSPPMNALWTHAADEGLAVCLLADPDALPGIQALCDQFPRTRVVIDHCARIGMRGAIDPADLDRLCRLADRPETYVKISAFYALGAKRAPYADLGLMIRQLRDAYGASRLMWASDAPFQTQGGHTYADSLALVRDRLDFLTREEKSWLLRRTAQTVYFA